MKWFRHESAAHADSSSQPVMSRPSSHTASISRS